MKTVKDILKTKSSEIWSLSPKAMVFDALKMMGEKEIGSIMVIDDKGKVVGIITERDYARKIILVGKASKETFVEEVMTPFDQMFTVKPETTVDDCMVLMTAKKIRHIPVFQGEKFVGIVTIGDVVKSIISEQEMLIEHLSNYIAGKYV
jgi:CBS domain-containing protein